MAKKKRKRKRKYASDEGFYELANGERDDVTFHDEILGDDANPDLAAQAVQDAIDRGVEPAMARLMYGLPTGGR